MATQEPKTNGRTSDKEPSTIRSFCVNRAGGRLLLRCVQDYIRSMDEGLSSLSTDNVAANDVLSISKWEAEDLEKLLVEVLNEGIAYRDGEAHSGVPGCRNGGSGSPPDDALSHF